jgi:hypothetical protein
MMTDTKTTNKKPTLATVKAFMRRNADNLYVQNLGDYNGMYDAFEYYRGDRPFRSVAGLYNPNKPKDFGIGVWFVSGAGRNAVRPYSYDGYEGYSVSNCCSDFVVAVKK